MSEGDDDGDQWTGKADGDQLCLTGVDSRFLIDAKEDTSQLRVDPSLLSSSPISVKRATLGQRPQGPTQAYKDRKSGGLASLVI